MSSSVLVVFLFLHSMFKYLAPPNLQTFAFMSCKVIKVFWLLDVLLSATSNYLNGFPQKDAEQ